MAFETSSSSPSSPATSAPPPTAREGPAGAILQFARLEGSARDDFWRRLAALKLDSLGLDDSPIPITGFYAPCSNHSVSQPLFLLDESFPPDLKDLPLQAQATHGDRNKCPIPGTLYNTNTLENFRAFDKKSLLRKEAEKLLDNIHSGKVEEDPVVLAQFLLISFADLKKWDFIYWFAFPALVLNPPAKSINIQPAKDVLTREEANSLSTACNQWRNSSLTAGIPFFIVSISSDSCATISQLKDWEKCQGNGQKLLFGFYDPCHAPRNPGWPLRNYLTFIALRYKVEKITFFSYREVHGLADLQSSLIGEAFIPTPEGWEESQYVPEAVGWVAKAAHRNLAESMDQKRLARSAAELNLKLMKWRTLPSLALENLANAKCLLLGAGTLGCQVARMLMAWGVRKITIVDSGQVSMSNPVRQSLYTFEDCLNGGKLKAAAAASHLQDILPDMDSKGIILAIPMPGHAIPPNEIHRVLEDCNLLQSLVSSHDVIFLLTDTRESRWLPTLLCATENKIAITAALGFDSYLVMRHGAGPLLDNSHPKIEGESAESISAKDGNRQLRLGCYFCNDVVAPINSTSNRTLDQQCTVTRPGLAPIASALAVELLVGLLHHPKGIHAEAEIANSIISSSEEPFGILPHQIRGLISQFSQMTLIGYSSSCCTACSSTVVSEYRKRGMEFVLEAINHPTYLEDITGLTDLMKSASTFTLDSDSDIDKGDDDDFVEI